MVGERDEAAKIDIVKLESTLKGYISPENSSISYKSCIFKTPTILSQHNPKAYVPDAFSFGPMHHGEHKLYATHKIKSLYLRDFLLRGDNISLTAVIKAVDAMEPEARACYEEQNPLDSITRDQLVQILVVDGCFLVELFYRSSQLPSHPDDPIQTMARMYQYLSHDLILLENQIPWLVLKALYSLLPMGSDPGQPTLESLVISFFSFHFSNKNLLKEPISSGNYEYKHVLDLIRESLIAPLKGKAKHKNKWIRIPPAAELSKAGVRLRKVERDGILEVTFDKKKGVLEIPHLLIQETTEATFRNLISYEQCYPNCEHIITSYVILMDNLIDTPKDLEALCEAGAIDNWLDPQEATKMFNGLYNDACVNEFYYIDLCQEVEIYCRRRWARLRVMYLNNFTSPLAIVSQVAGSIAFVLSILQTVFTIHK